MAEAVARVLAARAPRQAVTAGREAAFLVRAAAALPERLFDRALRRQFDLG